MRPHSHTEQIRSTQDMLCDLRRIVQYNAAIVTCAPFEQYRVPTKILLPGNGFADNEIIRCRSPPF